MKHKWIRTILILLICTVYFCSCSQSNNSTRIDEPNNGFGFEKINDNEFKKRQVTEEEYMETLQKIKELSSKGNMNDIVIRVGKTDVTRYDYEKEKILKQLDYSINDKEAMFLIIKPIVIENEAKRLKLSVSEDKVNDYVGEMQKLLETEDPNAEYILTYIDVLYDSKDDYFQETRKKAYGMYLREEFYRYAKTVDEYKSEEDYVIFLLKSADIQILDKELMNTLK